MRSLSCNANIKKGELMKALQVKAISFVFGSLLLVSASSYAQQVNCLAGGQALNVNNANVLQWKSSTHNQYRNRAHINGTLIKSYPDHSGHDHFEVQIGDQSKDTVEVIYNEEFGAIPDIPQGATFEACGDYITANSQAGGYPPSPDGAIVHWVHQSPNPGRHDSGFLIINGQLYGQGASGVGPKPPRHHK